MLFTRSVLLKMAVLQQFLLVSRMPSVGGQLFIPGIAVVIDPLLPHDRLTDALKGRLPKAERLINDVVRSMPSGSRPAGNEEVLSRCMHLQAEVSLHPPFLGVLS